MLTVRDDETAALWLRARLKPGEQEPAVTRLRANLQGRANEVVRMCKPQDFESEKGVDPILRNNPLAPMPVLGAEDAKRMIKIRRLPGEVIGDYIVREQRFTAR